MAYLEAARAQRSTAPSRQNRTAENLKTKLRTSAARKTAGAITTLAAREPLPWRRHPSAARPVTSRAAGLATRRAPSAIAAAPAAAVTHCGARPPLANRGTAHSTAAQSSKSCLTLNSLKKPEPRAAAKVPRAPSAPARTRARTAPQPKEFPRPAAFSKAPRSVLPPKAQAQNRAVEERRRSAKETAKLQAQEARDLRKAETKAQRDKVKADAKIARAAAKAQQKQDATRAKAAQIRGRRELPSRTQPASLPPTHLGRPPDELYPARTERPPG